MTHTDEVDEVASLVRAARDPQHPYHSLAQVLVKAYQQAAFGKGKERHANGLPFDEQPMQTISQLVGSPDGMVYQAIKKLQESQGMGKDAAMREVLGAINYCAGLYMYRGKGG